MKSFLFQSDKKASLFFLNIIFYGILWAINPNNKIIAIAFICLFFAYYYISKNIRSSLLYTFISSSIVFTGKQYSIILFPPGVYPIEMFPDGYRISFTISAAIIISVFIAVIHIHDWLIKKQFLFHPTLSTIFLFSYCIWNVVGDLINSKRPDISLLFSGFFCLNFFLYQYIRQLKKQHIVNIFTIISALIIVESIIAGLQYIARSPIYKHIELQSTEEFYGHVADEPTFQFRPVGTFGHANELALWLSFWIIIIFSYTYKANNSYLIVGQLAGIFTVILTQSRSAWIGITISILFLLYYLEKYRKIKSPKYFKKLKLLPLIAVSALCIIIVFPRLERSIYTFTEGGGVFRNQQTIETLAMINMHPLFGVGSQMQVSEGRMSNPSGVFGKIALSVHNWYLLTAVEHGIPSLIFFLLFVWINVKKNIYQINHATTLSPIFFTRVGYVASIGVICFIGIFQPFIGEGLIILTSAILDSDTKA